MSSTATRTALWLGSDDLAKKQFSDGIGTTNFKYMHNPVILGDDKGFNSCRVYELSDLLVWKTTCEAKGPGRNDWINPHTRRKIVVAEIEPVRYPGFKNYNETVAMLKKLDGWQEIPDPDGVPTLKQGVRLPNKLFNSAEMALQTEMAEQTKHFNNVKKEATDKRIAAKKALAEQRDEAAEELAKKKYEIEAAIATHKAETKAEFADIEEKYKTELDNLYAQDAAKKEEFTRREAAFMEADADDAAAGDTDVPDAAGGRVKRNRREQQPLTEAARLNIIAFLESVQRPLENAIMDCVDTAYLFAKFGRGISDYSVARQQLENFCGKAANDSEDSDDPSTKLLAKVEKCRDFTNKDSKAKVCYVFKWHSMRSLAIQFANVQHAGGVRTADRPKILAQMFRDVFEMHDISTARFSDVAIVDGLIKSGRVVKKSYMGDKDRTYFEFRPAALPHA
jgi:hypothetical protein